MPTTADDVITGLLAQHQQIKLLFAQIATASGDHRKQLFQELVGVMAVHESVEQALIHPAAETVIADGATVVGQRLAEEEEAKSALAGLYELDVDEAQFDVQLAELRDAVAAHAQAEEELEFPQLQEVVDPVELARMQETLRAAQTMLPLPGPPKDVFDQVSVALRDAMTMTDGEQRS
ncbi:hemerythrin superfamily protein [Allocatelliglobosispora scoriae]|uniref:Hemerythrin superfamily protein n=1 Tax=Allocatelliglobosispora scoriae TaxID=643052 RepID=A0A841C318_9ACTN|nr:hemerythrin domain-containing protein [Allocatelliglobosispora scoriae]MBB5874305.1 hemerythrin superfamily protein [Allocatelliglobosispora scoriae]